MFKITFVNSPTLVCELHFSRNEGSVHWNINGLGGTEVEDFLGPGISFIPNKTWTKEL